MIDYLNKFKLNGKVAVVTGGTGLIGKEVSIALAQAGARVMILDINETKGLSIEEECKANGLDVKFMKFDITNIKDYSKKIKKLFNSERKIDILVNLAYPRTKDWGNKLGDIKEDSWKKNVEMQMNSYCLLTKEVAELMVKNGIKGSIINYGSTYGVVGPDFGVYSRTELTCPAAYSAIKGGILNFSKYAASYYGKDGIRINCLCPGGIFNRQNKKFVKNYRERTPLNRMGKPDEVATATLFLASDASSYITGTTFMVDGGWTCI